MDLAELGERLFAAAKQNNERRLLVLAGGQDAGYTALEQILADRPSPRALLVSPDHREGYQRIAPDRTKRLLGTTHQAIVYDCHQGFSPNRLGRVCGAIDGNGVGILLVPPLNEWPNRGGNSVQQLAVEPYPENAVGGRFRQRLVTTLHRHGGVAIVDLDNEQIIADGSYTSTGGLLAKADPTVPENRSFSRLVYNLCLTGDQSRCLQQLETLIDDRAAVVLTAQRGRGKSSVAGLAAAELTRRGNDVVVTAPEPENTTALFQRVGEVLGKETHHGKRTFRLQESGGSVRYLSPSAAIEADPEVLIVDEAAALPVAVLEAALAVERVAFVSTIHGYEGAGRGFSLAFQDTLDQLDRPVYRCQLTQPIRYAQTDPIEPWLSDALLLDARPPVKQRVANIDAEDLTYRSVHPEALIQDEQLLRELFGLLVYAHYRTEPNDLERILDAPNLHIRGLFDGDTVVAAAVVAREGGLSPATRKTIRDGHRISGHMIPELLISQLSDPDAGEPIGLRVMRIVTHPAVQSQGYGSRLLDELRSEAAQDDPSGTLTKADWLGVAYGATPQLVRFWRTNGYRPVHLATTQSDRSGRHSTIMLKPLTTTGQTLYRHHGQMFAQRIRAVLADSLCDLDPDVIRAVLRGIDPSLCPPLTINEWEWRVVQDVAAGHGTLDVAPGPFGRLALQYFADHPDSATAPLNDRQERLLVFRALQYQDWETTQRELEYPSIRMCRRAFTPIAAQLLDQYRQEDRSTTT